MKHTILCKSPRTRLLTSLFAMGFGGMLGSLFTVFSGLEPNIVILLVSLAVILLGGIGLIVSRRKDHDVCFMNPDSLCRMIGERCEYKSP